MIETIVIEGRLIYQGPRTPLESSRLPFPISYCFYDPDTGHVWASRVIHGGGFIYTPAKPPEILLPYEERQLDFPLEIAMWICDFLLEKHRREQVTNTSTKGTPNGRVGDRQDLQPANPA